MDKIDLNDLNNTIKKKVQNNWDVKLLSALYLVDDYIRYDMLNDLDNNISQLDFISKYKKELNEIGFNKKIQK